MQNFRSIGPGKLITYALIGFAAQDLIRRGLRYYSAQKQEKEDLIRYNEAIDLASADSFPASDPPAYTRTTAVSVH